MATLYKIRNNIIYDLIAELSGARFRARVSIYDWHGRGSGGGWAGGLEKRSKYAAAKSTIRKIAELRERYVRLAIPEDSLVHRPPHSGYAPTFNPPTYSPPRPCVRPPLRISVVILPFFRSRTRLANLNCNLVSKLERSSLIIVQACVPIFPSPSFLFCFYALTQSFCAASRSVVHYVRYGAPPRL